MEFLGENAEALIALAALFLAIWQGYLQRKHNKLSLRPHLSFNRCVQTLSPQIKLSLINAGPGPALIKNVLVYLDDVLLSSTVIDWNNIMHELQINTIWGGGNFIKGATIPPQHEIDVFLYKTTELDSHEGLDVCAIQQTLNRIKVVVEYDSVYGETFRESNLFD